MALSETGLDDLQQHYDELLHLTPHATRLLAAPGLTDPLCQRYAATRFARVEDVLPAVPLTGVSMSLAAILEPLFEEVTTRHEVKPDGTLSYGSRFRRIDPACLGNPDTRAKLERLFDRLGLDTFGAALGHKLTPLIRHIVGDVRYSRTYLYLYEEADYIGAHDDHHVGNRIDVQFPVTVGGVGGIRVLSDGLFRIQYDNAGSMNILGPSMWHDVPPLLRAAPATPPRRVNLGLRFTPD
jgi:hypothetical protein